MKNLIFVILTFILIGCHVEVNDVPKGSYRLIQCGWAETCSHMEIFNAKEACDEVMTQLKKSYGNAAFVCEEVK